MKQKLLEEPVVVGGISGGVLAALVLQVFAALGSYGIQVTPELQALVNTLVMVLFPVIAAAVARMYTTSLANPRDNEGNALTAELPNVP